MTELVNAGNAISKLMLETLAPTLRGAHIGMLQFDHRSTIPSD